MADPVASAVLSDLRWGDPRTVTVSVVDGAGAPVPLDGATWSASVRQSPSSTDVVEMAVDTSQAASGVLGLSLTGAQTRTLPHRIVGDLEGSTFGTVLTFSAVVQRDVTRGASEPTGGLVDAITITYDGTGTTLSETTLALLVAGATGPQGEVGPQGPQGPAGSDADATAAIEAHRVDTTDVHGIADTALLETTTGAQSKADAAQAAAEAAAAAADTALDGRLDTVETTLPLKADLVGGVVPTAQMPAISIMERVPVADEAARLLLANPGDVQIGDVAVQADTGTTWLLVADDPSLAGSWKAIDQADAVSSVNGQTGTVVLGKADVGLGSVDNTADLSKPISTAAQTALDAKAPVASPALTGTPTAPTAAPGTNTTQIATTAHVKTAVDNATSSAVPKATLDANTLLKADADDTPTALAVPASRIVGRKATGGIGALTTAEVAGLFGTPDGTKFLADDGTLKAPAGGGAVVGARVYRLDSETALALPNSTVVSVPFLSEEYDTNGFHSTVTNPARFTIPAGLGGIYDLSAVAIFSTNATGRRVVRFTKNGIGPIIRADAPAVSGAATVLAAAGAGVPLAAGDYVDVEVFHDSGSGSLTMSGNGFLIHESSTDVGLHDIVAFAAITRQGNRP